MDEIEGRVLNMVQSGQRERILDAFGKLVAERGYGATTMADIAERARISRSELFELFERKGDLVGAALLRTGVAAKARIEAARVQTAEITPWPARLQRLLELYLDDMANDANYMRLTITEPAALSDADPGVRVAMRDGYLASIRSIALDISARTGGEPISETEAIFVSAGMSELLARRIHGGMEPGDALRSLATPTTEIIVRLVRGGRMPAGDPPAEAN
ncbi:MAG: helix-turn-helix domain containing protein [Patulibacter minatonensis]